MPKASKDFYIVFIDEVGFMIEPLVITTWARRGHRPIIKIADNRHDRISVIGAIAFNMKAKNYRFFFHLSGDNTNFRGYSVVPFLNRLYNKLRKPIHLVWDSIRIHTAEPVKVFLHAHQAINVFFFPPYAPELNPVEHIWGYIKRHRLANYCPNNLVELRKRVRSEMFRIQKKPDLIKSLSHHAGLNLD
jgi:transposase